MVVLQDMVGIMAWNDGALNVTKAKQNFLADFKSMIDARYNAPSIVQWTAFNEGDCVSDFDVASVVSTFEALDGLSSPHGLLGMGRLIDTNSGGPADALGLADVHDVQ